MRNMKQQLMISHDKIAALRLVKLQWSWGLVLVNQLSRWAVPQRSLCTMDC